CFVQAPAKRLHKMYIHIGRTVMEEPDHRDCLLLRARCERPSGYTAADKCDEVPAASWGLPQGQGSWTKYSSSWSGSVARIAIKSGADHQNAARVQARAFPTQP